MSVTEKYVFNDKLQELPLGDGEGTVFYNPEKEKTHVLDEVARDVIEMFKIPSTIEEAVNKLSEMYDEDKAVIEKDVKDFAAEAIEENIILLYEGSELSEKKM